MPKCEGLGAVDLEAYGGGQCDEGVVGVEANGVDGLLCHLARAVHLLFNYNRTSNILKKANIKQIILHNHSFYIVYLFDIQMLKLKGFF